MSKVRINDLAREMEVKSRQILDVLGELGLGEGKTHSSSIEDYEADKVRAQFERGTKSGAHAGGGSARGSQTITPKIDLSHVSKPGDVMKAILAKKQEQETEARKSHVPARPAAPAASNAPAKPAPPAVAVAAPPAAASATGHCFKATSGRSGGRVARVCRYSTSRRRGRTASGGGQAAGNSGSAQNGHSRSTCGRCA
jgi:translation initiation factor IF-2